MANQAATLAFLYLTKRTSWRGLETVGRYRKFKAISTWSKGSSGDCISPWPVLLVVKARMQAVSYGLDAYRITSARDRNRCRLSNEEAGNNFRSSMTDPLRRRTRWVTIYRSRRFTPSFSAT